MPKVDPIDPKLAEWCWRNNRIEPLLFPWQLKAYRKREEVLKSGGIRFVICAGAGLGKSTWLVILATMKALHNPGTEVLYSAPTQTSLADFIRKVVNVAWEHLPDDLRPIYMASDDVFKFKNGSNITMRGLDLKTYKRRRGDKYNLVVIDEAGFTSDLKDAVESAIMPRVRKGKGTIILSSTPPDNPAHDFEAYCKKAEEDGHYFHAGIHDGHLTEEEINEIEKDTDADVFRIEYLAERGHIESGRAIIPEFKINHIDRIKRSPLHHRFKYYIVMDQAGAADNTAVVFGYFHQGLRKIVIEKELVIPGHEVVPSVFSKEVKKIVTELQMQIKDIRWICDVNERIFVNQLIQEYGLPFAIVQKPRDLGLKGSTKKMRQFFKDDKIIIDPECENLIACCQSGVWTKSRDSWDRSATLKHLDSLAALCYLLGQADLTIDLPGDIDHETGAVKVKTDQETYADFIKALNPLGTKKQDTINANSHNYWGSQF